jgi:glycine cleavage system aminomethyltransferase T
VQYKESIPVSHKQVRASAGLFDVSHMGQVEIHGDRKHRLNFLEGLCVIIFIIFHFHVFICALFIQPSELHELKVGQMKLSSLTNERGGILPMVFNGS